MNNFLTVEDANTLIYDNQEFWWYEIDIGKISTGTEDFTDIKYDFCEISRVYKGGQREEYEYTVKVFNNIWTTAYDVINEPDTFWGCFQTSVEGNILKIPHGTLHTRILLYMGPKEIGTEVPYFGGCMGYYLVNDKISLNLKDLKVPQIVEYWVRRTGVLWESTCILTKGYNLILDTGTTPSAVGYLYVNILKTDFVFDCTDSLVVGRVNKVCLGADTDYKPNGDFVDEYIPIIKAEYNGKELPVYFDESVNDYVFNLDLSDKKAPQKVRFKVNVETNDALNNSVTPVVLDAGYEVISSYDGLVSACGNGGASSIRLGADITLTSSIPITHNIKIIGDDYQLDLNSQGFVLSEDVTFKAENILFDNGNIAIKQSKNSSVELTGCIFNNCTGFGSCITCDIDYDSLSVEDDFKTTLTNCLFTNNNLCIVHSGELTINGCKYHNTDTDYIDKENVAFLYQFDGEANIKNSIFDIDYDTDSLCSNEENIGFAQALLQCGVTAKINNATSKDLKQNDNLPFDSNATHIFCKYYYPQLETCIYTSPTIHNEDKAVCYTVSNENWIYKQNVQITRASDGNENRYNPIKWEEIT